MKELDENAEVSNHVEPVVILPCPFCGGKAKLHGGAYSQEACSVFCIECRASINGTMDKKETIELWNKRAI